MRGRMVVVSKFISKMECKYIYDKKCNITGAPCWYLVSGVEQVTCENYEKEEYDPNSPEHERDVPETES